MFWALLVCSICMSLCILCTTTIYVELVFNFLLGFSVNQMQHYYNVITESHSVVVLILTSSHQLLNIDNLLCSWHDLSLLSSKPGTYKWIIDCLSTLCQYKSHIQTWSRSWTHLLADILLESSLRSHLNGVLRALIPCPKILTDVKIWGVVVSSLVSLLSAELS